MWLKWKPAFIQKFLQLWQLSGFTVLSPPPWPLHSITKLCHFSFSIHVVWQSFQLVSKVIINLLEGIEEFVLETYSLSFSECWNQLFLYAWSSFFRIQFSVLVKLSSFLLWTRSMYPAFYHKNFTPALIVHFSYASVSKFQCHKGEFTQKFCINTFKMSTVCYEIYHIYIAMTWTSFPVHFQSWVFIYTDWNPVYVWMPPPPYTYVHGCTHARAHARAHTHRA